MKHQKKMKEITYPIQGCRMLTHLEIELAAASKEATLSIQGLL